MRYGLGLDDPAPRKDGRKSEERVPRRAGPQPRPSCGIAGDQPSYGGGLGLFRIEPGGQPVRLQGALQGRHAHSRLCLDGLRDLVDAQDSVHVRGVDDHRVLDRLRTARQPGPPAPRDDRGPRLLCPRQRDRHML